MDEFSQAWTRAAKIEGWLTEGQARMLFDAARQVGGGEAVVEIGSHHGRSTVVLAAARTQAAQLLAVDPFEGERWGGGAAALDVFWGNLRSAGVDGEVTLMRMRGAQAGAAWSGAPVGLLYVDGAHDYSSVVADLTAWLPHLSPTASLLIHDAYSSVGVTGAVFRELFGSPSWVYAGASRSLACFRRPPSQGLTPRLLSAARMAGRLPWFARNIAIKVAMRQGWTSLPRLLGHTEDGCPY